MLREHGLDQVVEVIQAPIECEKGGARGEYHGYSRKAFDTLPDASVDLLFVDGPPAYAPGSTARQESVAAFLPKLAAEAVIVFDDARRDARQIDAIACELPDCERIDFPTEKGTTLLRCTSAARQTCRSQFCALWPS
jgi:hypothetical protein